MLWERFFLVTYLFLLQIFGRQKDDIWSYLCKSKGNFLLSVEDALHGSGTKNDLQHQLCKLSAVDSTAFTIQVLRSLNWTAVLDQVAAITARSGHNLNLTDLIVAFEAAQNMRKEVGNLSYDLTILWRLENIEWFITTVLVCSVLYLKAKNEGTSTKKHN